ncbi:hypothetical protein [Citricoccus sp. CH26A]|uniref:SLOG cluster 4 domain-containing protein n=1 Tax=Citricoccus TaxID=169133 RepID=UPI001300C507
MPIDPARCVIGVFGSNSPSDPELYAVKLLGKQIRIAGAVLLTGGDLPVGEPVTVKDAAIWGTTCEALPEEPPASWIGVANKSQAAEPQWRGESSVVVTPGWRHRRNFVEACLCDAAIAVGITSKGTASEALFSLYLNRPLLVVGDIPKDERNIWRLYPRASQRVHPPNHPDMAIERGILDAYAWAQDREALLDVRPLPNDAASAGALVNELLARATHNASRRNFDRLVDERGWDHFVASSLRAAGRP